MASLTERMVGAAKLDVHTYEEVEADTTATGQAVLVVVIYTVCLGIGASIATGGGISPIGLVVSIAAALLGWVARAFLIFVIGTKLLPEPETHSDMGELLRTIGFATTPGILFIGFALAPIIGRLVVLLALVVVIWMIVALVIAVRQALDYKSTWRAIGVVILAVIAESIIVSILGG